MRISCTLLALTLPAALACDPDAGASDPPDAATGPLDGSGGSTAIPDGSGDPGPGGALVNDARPGQDVEGPAADAGLDVLPDARSAPESDAAIVCAPGIPADCADRTTQRVCAEGGTSFVSVACPAGAACRAGECVSECQIEGKYPAYIGCSYWSLDLDNYPDPFGDPSAIPHAVVIANASAAQATVTITGPAGGPPLPGAQFSIPAGELRVYTFPRFDVDGTGISDRAFEIQSDWPVVAYQFNPLNNVGVASNDGTVLLPDEALGSEYYAFSWPTSPLAALGIPSQHGYFTIVATREGETQVTITVAAAVAEGPGVPAMAEGETATFVLQRGQVLNIEADGSSLAAGNWDLTGSHIVASQPVAVFGGHEEAVVGDGCCAEHLEHQLYPVNTWGMHYLAAHSEPRGGSTDVWRILAHEGATTISTDPPQAGASNVTLDAGQWIEIPATDSFEILADKPISVAQYLASQETTVDFIGDPALIMAVPVEQFRRSYLVLTPADYSENWLTVLRPAGQTVFLDGEPVADVGFAPIGAGDYEFAWVPVEPGPHALVGEAPFGLVAIGYAQAVSYGLAAGLDLVPRVPGAP